MAKASQESAEIRAGLSRKMLTELGFTLPVSKTKIPLLNPRSFTPYRKTETITKETYVLDNSVESTAAIVSSNEHDQVGLEYWDLLHERKFVWLPMNTVKQRMAAVKQLKKLLSKA